MITKEAIEAARISIMEVFQLENCGDLQAEAILTAAFAATDIASENERLRAALHELDEYLRYNTVLSDDPGVERIFAKAFSTSALERT